MFGFLKDKLKDALKKFTQDVDEKSEKTIEKKEKKTEKKPATKEKAKENIKGQKKETLIKIKKEKKPQKEKPVQEEQKQALLEEITELPKEKEVAEETKETPKEEKKGFFSRLKESIFKEEKEEPTKAEEGEQEESEEEEEAESEEREEEPKESEETEEVSKEKGFFTRFKESITTTTLSDDKFEDVFSDLEIALLENNVAVEVIDKIRDDLKKSLVAQRIPRGKLEEHIQKTLKHSVSDLFDLPSIDLFARIKQKKEKPFIISFVGINGSGKTTTIAKLAHLLKKHNLTIVIAAADTFRAAAIQQLEEHGEKLGVKVIKHDYGADPAAVAFDAVKYAHAKSIDVVLIDTAGRMHSNTNLIDEMKKIVRVAKPDLKIFVGESITGNDCVEQARTFNEAISFDCIILTKADVDEKGGAALSVSYITKKPISYFGTGQKYDDLEVFDKEKVMGSIGL
ncbi:MAG: signal recognition particle-docking protein FtsY [Candidatus Woesearchaeota archaeon]|nr:signal recognition particle-docking protein FtsY [Candidatus Woesearchaeota archaeon]